MSVHVSQSASFSEWYISHMCWIRFMHLPRATQTPLPMVGNPQHPLPWVQGSAMAETPYEAKLKVSQCVWLFATPWAVACQIPVHEILQERILEWVAISFSRGFSQPRGRTQVSHIADGFFSIWASREAQEYWHEKPILPPGIFLTQGSNLCLLHFRQILYQLNNQGRPKTGLTRS